MTTNTRTAAEAARALAAEAEHRETMAQIAWAEVGARQGRLEFYLGSLRVMVQGPDNPALVDEAREACRALENALAAYGIEKANAKAFRQAAVAAARATD